MNQKRSTLPVSTLACALALALTPAAAQRGPAPGKRNIDLAICLDTSGSMKGLIDSARQSIWAIVNDLALAEPAPELRIALLTFGNASHPAANGWVRVDTGFTGNLDLVSEKLFALTTNGGTEFVGRVLQAALQQLEWTGASDALKLIVVAGNESADQDKLVDFRAQCKAAIARGIMVNSIYCGNPGDQLAPDWRQVATLADGHFDAIDQDGTVALKSPFDAEIATLSSALNTTYIPMGSAGQGGRQSQVRQDRNASGLNSQAAAQRGYAKASRSYFCSWDLVDCLRTKQVTLSEVQVTDLPENMRKMSVAEREKYVAAMQAKREGIQKQINDLRGKREAWCAAELRRIRAGKSETFEGAVRKSVRAQAEAKGLRFRATPVAGRSGGN